MLTVTLFDANHCPGSVMFLFSGYFGNILYTGDFRFKSDMFENFQLPLVDVLYLDNTYCSPRCIFPTRENAIEAILSQLCTCLMKCGRIFIGLDNLGKEDLLQQIVRERKCKICVRPARKEVMDILGFSDIATIKENETNIFVIPTNEVSCKNFEKWNKESKTHAILATARFCGYNFKPFSKFSDIHVIPYSNHSSYSELKKFIQVVKPSAIIPIVGKHRKGIFGIDISDRADMSVFKRFLRETPPRECTIPESVKRAMNNAEKHYVHSLPTKKRRIARPLKSIRRKPHSAGVRYIVAEDSETDSDPDAIHIEEMPSQNKTLRGPKPASDEISDFSSDSYESDSSWEITFITSKGKNNVEIKAEE